MKQANSLILFSLVGLASLSFLSNDLSIVNSGVRLPINQNSSPFCFLGKSPVCSTDNITFPNICVLLLLGKTKESEGWCKPTTSITKISVLTFKTPNNGFLTSTQKSHSTSLYPCNSAYNPVCGNNGVTYASRCRLDCAKVKFARPGPCGYQNWLESPHFNCPCQYEFDPVCGKDGSTYENECALRCGHQSLNYKGACRLPCNCSNVYKPVCSKQHKTFKNRCLLKCQKHEFFKKGKCPDRKPKYCSHCEGLDSPVCGVNGLTYDNKCYLRCVGVEFYGDGVCPDDTGYSKNQSNLPSCFSCKKVKLPVCAKDNKTYDNACLARCKGLNIQYKGKCLAGSQDSNGKCECSYKKDEVCGTDGRTYANKCEAKCQKIRVFSRSACQPGNPQYCSFICKHFSGYPVCGKDFKTYLNECIASRCLRIPIKSFNICEPLDSFNHPNEFDYMKLTMKEAQRYRCRNKRHFSQSERFSSSNTIRNPRRITDQNRNANINLFNTNKKYPQSSLNSFKKLKSIPNQRNLKNNNRVSMLGQSIFNPSSKSDIIKNAANKIQNLNLKDKKGVLEVYKILFPRGIAIDPKVEPFRKNLELVLKSHVGRSS